MIYVVRTGPAEGRERMDEVLASAMAGREFKFINSPDTFFETLRERSLEKVGNPLAGYDRYLFAVHLPANGYVPEWHEIITFLTEHHDLMERCCAGVIVDGDGALFTKGFGRKLIFAANMAGCSFMGKPLVEATGDLKNFDTVARVNAVTNEEAYRLAVANLVDRLEVFRLPYKKDPKILAVHASSRRTSNSLLLWGMVKVGLAGRAEIEEISVRNGEIIDCRGCSFEACKHYGETGECFYGGVMVETVYPAISECDELVLICPNYNDAVPANLSALFNRLTALFYNSDFSSKRVYAMIVSGYSGSDIIAEQIIGAMNINKGFALPPHFAMMETANDPRSVVKCPGVDARAEAMAWSMTNV